MKFCTNCGTQLPDNAYVCNQCGTAFEQPPVQQNYAPPTGYAQQPQQNYAPPQGYNPNPGYAQQGYAPNQGYGQQPQGYTPYAPVHQPSGLETAAKILMIISTVVTGLYLIPLAWCLPMTISYCNKLKSGQPVSMGFKICTLLFVNMIAGILMLCDNKNQ